MLSAFENKTFNFRVNNHILDCNKLYQAESFSQKLFQYNNYALFEGKILKLAQTENQINISEAILCTIS